MVIKKMLFVLSDQLTMVCEEGEENQKYETNGEGGDVETIATVTRDGTLT